MTLFKPTLIVTRVIIKRDSKIAYDERFHSGVNVIRGENSSGKSTILNFIFYGLGGDLFNWSDVALLCTHVWLEVELNGVPVTLRREISKTSRSSMEIFGGRYEDALDAPIESWKRYPYARTNNLENFSQVLFRLLEMPDVALETSGNITMHQILRVLYADQIKQIDAIFRDESFDNADLRETVGNLLCGAYDNDVYDAQRELKNTEKSFDDAASELKSIIAILGGEDGVSVEWVETTRNNLNAERDRLSNAIEAGESEFYQAEKLDHITLSEQETAYKKVQEIQKSLLSKRDEIRRTELDIADSADFIRQIENKIDALRDAETVAHFILGVQFSSCPACFAEVDNEDHIAACPLCKTPFDSERAKDRIAGLINEAAIQLKQSKRLQGNRAVSLEELKKTETQLQEQWQTAAHELETLQSLPTSEARKQMRDLNRQLGSIDNQIKELTKKAALAERIQTLSRKKQQLAMKIEELRDYIDKTKAKQASRLRTAKTLMENETIELLKRDLSRQDSFENPQSVSFSFRENKISVDEHDYFSASSRVILKCSFMLGFLKSALKDRAFRHPRFTLIDVTENNGMEIERSYNLQNQMIKLSAEAKVEHQIIYATAFPTPDADDDQLIGHYSTRENRTLRFSN